MNNTFHSKVEEIVFEKLKDAFAKSKFEIKSNIKVQGISGQYWIDLLVVYENSPYIVVEIKGALNEFNFDSAVAQVTKYSNSLNTKYGIVTDGDKYFLIDNQKQTGEYKKLNDIINYVRVFEPYKPVEEYQKLIASSFRDSANIFLSNNLKLHSLLESDAVSRNIRFDNIRNEYFFNGRENTDISFENKIFDCLVPSDDSREICRYASFESMFEMLRNSSIRLNGLSGMNDRSEVMYVDNYLSDNNDYYDVLSEMHHSTVRALNRRYISSLTDIKHKDELTFWRLYAGDATGVCLVFKLNKRSVDSPIQVRKVSYAKNDNSHPELDFLKYISTNIKKKTKSTFSFRKIGLWKNYFKPHEYSVEDEIRLLVIDNGKLGEKKKDWVRTFTHSIVNPVIDFDLNSNVLPIKLQQVIIGPKCPESIINKIQIEELIRQNIPITNGTKRIAVCQSSIKNYR